MNTRLAVVIASLASLGVLAAGAVWGLAQPGLSDGTFVRAADGTIYAVSSGAKIRLAAAPDPGLLDSLRDGPAAASVSELNAAVAAVLPTPVVTSPVQPVIGQSLRVCADVDIPFQAEVVDAQWQKTVQDRDATGTAMWAVVFVNMTNLTNTETNPTRGPTPAIKLVDERGRVFEGTLGGTLFDLQQTLASANGLNSFDRYVRPGITEERVIAFEVAPDVQRLTVVSQVACR